MATDGRLDEASWHSAIPRTSFYEIYPADTGHPPVATKVLFLYDDRNIYVAVRALDPEADAIRAPIVRRDGVLADQDYVEVFLDPLNTRRSAVFFRVNARGIVTDGQYDDKNRVRDYSPDFNFDAAASIDEEGWTAEIRIPLSSLRYQAGVENSWAYVLYRNLPREQAVMLASAPIPRGASCDLCYANLLEGVPIARSGSLSVIPHIAYARLDGDFSSSDEFEAGVDLTWKARENTVIDATILPDFSQIEADAPQLTANTQFALAVTEKRPFFLEGIDLLTTQIPAIYTRAFTDPDAGVRITNRSSRHEYTALALRDAGAGAVIEPGPINSRMGLQDFESDAFAGRNRFLLQNGTLGMLATARFNDDGSHNVVIGADGTWTPSPADQFSAQFLSSQTRNPNRPDLLDTWTGQQLDGSAYTLGWTHSAYSGFASVEYHSYSRGFRAWNGFVTQVGVSTLTSVGNLYLYPQGHPLVTRYGPSLTLMRTQDEDGTELSQMLSPGIAVRAAHDTLLTLSWQPKATIMTAAGRRSYDSFALGLASTPFPWMPNAHLSLTAGEMADVTTGLVGHGVSVRAATPIRLARLEINPAIGYQTLGMRTRDSDDKLFTQRNFSLSLTWHFSGHLNARLTHQDDTLVARPPFAELQSPVRTTSRMFAILLSYQSDWQTRWFLGVMQNSNRAEGTQAESRGQKQIFAKLSYAFSN